MKLTTTRAALVALTGWTAATARTGISGGRGEYTRVMLTAEACGTLTAARFGYDVSAVARGLAEVGEPGRVLVSARLLSRLAAALPVREPVDIASDGTRVTLTAGGARYTLATADPDSYPQIAAPGAHVAEFDPKALAAVLAAVLPAAGTDDTLPVLTAVRLRLGDGIAELAATDRYRAIIATCPYAPGPAEAPGAVTEALIPARELAAATKRPGADPVRIAVTPETVTLAAADRHAVIRQISGEFPNLHKLIPGPDKVTATFTASAAELAAALKRAAVVAERGTPVRLALPLAAEGGPGAAEALIQSGTGDDASLAESVRLTAFDGEPVSIAFNPGYLLGGIAVIARSASTGARIAVTGPYRPAVITPAAGWDRPGAWTYIVMPVKHAG